MTFIITEADKKFLRTAKGRMLDGHISFLAARNQVSIDVAKKEIESYLHPAIEIPKLRHQLVETLPVVNQAIILPPKKIKNSRRIYSFY